MYEVSCKVNDCDFINIFLQGVIYKNVIFASVVSLQSFRTAFLTSVSPNVLIEHGMTYLITLGIRCLTLTAFLLFMAWGRFATRYNNFKYFAALFLASHAARIVTESSMDAVALQ